MVANNHLVPDDRRKLMFQLFYLTIPKSSCSQPIPCVILDSNHIAYNQVLQYFTSILLTTKKKKKTRKELFISTGANKLSPIQPTCDDTKWDITTLISQYREGFPTSLLAYLIWIRWDNTSWFVCYAAVFCVLTNMYFAWQLWFWYTVLLEQQWLRVPLFFTFPLTLTSCVCSSPSELRRQNWTQSTVTSCGWGFMFYK